MWCVKTPSPSSRLSVHSQTMPVFFFKELIAEPGLEPGVGEHESPVLANYTTPQYFPGCRRVRLPLGVSGRQRLFFCSASKVFGRRQTLRLAHICPPESAGGQLTHFVVFQSHPQESNPQHSEYKTDALPVELGRLIFTCQKVCGSARSDRSARKKRGFMECLR